MLPAVLLTTKRLPSFFYFSNTVFRIDMDRIMTWLPVELVCYGWTEPVGKFSRKAIAQYCSPNPLGEANQFCNVVNAQQSVGQNFRDRTR